MNPINNPHDFNVVDLCLAYLGGDLDEASSKAFEKQLESDPAIAECLLQQSETWVTVAASMQDSDAATSTVSMHSTTLAASTTTPASSRFAFIAVVVAASVALFVFGFNRLGNDNEESLLALAWANQSTLENQLEPLDLLNRDMAELEVVELTGDETDLSIEEDSFDWMLVAISNQWNMKKGESQQRENSMGGSSDEG